MVIWHDLGVGLELENLAAWFLCSAPVGPVEEQRAMRAGKLLGGGGGGGYSNQWAMILINRRRIRLGILMMAYVRRPLKICV